MPDAVLTEVDGGVAVITINRPEAKNAVNGAVATGMAAALDDLDARKDVSVLVLTGAGGTFSAGMDLKGFLTGDSPLAEGRGFGGIVERPPAKPIIAAVESKFGLPEVKRGLVAGAGGLLRLPRRIPYHAAMELALSGDHYPASRLAELGLVNKITSPGEALAGARELAAKIAENAPLALAATKRVIVESPDWDSADQFARQGEIINPVFGSKDAMEGAAAFAEKRRPEWSGE
jgi:enoyl-CoA hydratase